MKGRSRYDIQVASKNIAALTIELTADDLRGIDAASRIKVTGYRYPALETDRTRR